MRLMRIGDYISEHDPVAAGRVVGRIYALANNFADYPEMGRLGRVKGTRELIVPEFPYIVAYRVKDNAIHVITVLHALRKWPDHF